MKLGLQAKYAVAIFLLVCLITITLTGINLWRTGTVVHKVANESSRIMEEELLKQVERKALLLAGVVGEDLKKALSRYNTQEIFEITKAVNGQEGILSVYAYGPEGEVIHGETDEGLFLNEAVTRRAIEESIAAKKLITRGASDTLDVTLPISSSDEILGAAVVRFSLKEIKDDMRQIKAGLEDMSKQALEQNMLAMIATAALLFFVGIISAGLVARRFSRPISTLKGYVDRISQGDYNADIQVERADEIGDLSNTFKTMAQTLKKTTVSRDYVSNIINHMTDLLIVIDSQKKIRTINTPARYLLGYKEEELVGRHIRTILVEPEDSPLRGGKIDKLLGTGNMMNVEMYYKTKRGNMIPVLFGSSVVRNEGGDVVWIVCNAKDITARKKTERSLQEAYDRLRNTQAQLIQAEKMEAIGRIASGVAHEVKNPLGIILQSVDYLEGKFSKEDKTVFEMFQIIKENIERADGIVRALVDFSKASELNLKPSDINSILEDSIILIQHRIKLKKIEIVKKLARDLPNVLVDKGKMEQVFINVFLNAVQSMKEDGKLFIHTYRRKLEKVGFRIGRRKSDGDYFEPGEKAVVIEVEDTGGGISKENLNRIFDPFFSTKLSQGGTGLGLAVTRSIIDMHKGIIEIKSKEGRGTKVTINLKAAGQGG